MQVPAYIEYAQDVLEGRVVACEYVKLACERFFSFLESEEYEFRSKEVERVIDFFKSAKHYTGRHAQKPFLLEPWQQLAIAHIFGFYRKDDGTRLTKDVYIDCARKQGKTAMIALISLYMLIADGEMNAEVDLAANSKEQAKICFEMCSAFGRTIDPKLQYLEPYRDRIKFDYTLSTLRVQAAQDTTMDGYNASCYLVDEYAGAPNNRVKAVLESSQGMRENPLGIIITTAGFNKLGPCYEYRSVCIEILKGLKEEDSRFILIYTLDEGDDWKDEKVWIKSNPNLGVTVSRSYLRKEVQKAINSPSEEVNVKTKNLNVWCDSVDVWIPDNYILDASIDMDFSQFEGYECWIGVDLSATSDLTAVSYMFIKDDIPHFITKYYLPMAALSEKRFAIQYSEWKRAGALTITAGNVTDYDYITNDIMAVSKKCRIMSIGYDSWNAISWAVQMEELGMPLMPFSQALGNFNRPTKELERLLLSGRAKIDNNVITRHCFRNVVLARDHNGNVKPSKKYAEKRIDGTISMLQSIGVYYTSPRYGEFY